MTLIALLWLILAPIFLVIIGMILYFFAKIFKLPELFGLSGSIASTVRFLMSFGVVILFIVSLWLPDRLEFKRVCEERGEPKIIKKEKADGFFLDDATEYRVVRYLREEGFLWLETRSIYNRDKFTRYEKMGVKIEQREIDQLTAEFVVKSNFQDRGSYTITDLSIFRRGSGEVLATASSLHFKGGRALVYFGVWGFAFAKNSEGFNKMYHLAMDTLGGN
jgi:hypothetical protein